MQQCTTDELASIGRCQGILRAPRVPTTDQEYISELTLGPPIDDHKQWPDNLNGNQVMYPAVLLKDVTDNTETITMQQAGNQVKHTTIINREEIVDHLPYHAHDDAQSRPTTPSHAHLTSTSTTS